MTPDEFRETVLPPLMAAWEQQCFCANPGFRKLLSFDFRQYEIGPVGLADAELLINAIIWERFTRQGEPDSAAGEATQSYTCPQCGAVCTEVYSEFSINMHQSTVTFHDAPAPECEGLYLVGYFGFRRDDFAKVNDFRQAASVEEFTQALTGG